MLHYIYTFACNTAYFGISYILKDFIYRNIQRKKRNLILYKDIDKISTV